ncbi:MAG: hypothetical protein FWC47_15290 [Oscillospiraceae bacterium]|nr:hypothetical protein [Oscillospiraceae bacterium]
MQDETEISESETEEEEEKKGLSEMYYGFCDKVIAFSEFASENKLTEAADHVTGGDVGEALDVLVQFKEYFEAAVNSPKAQELFDKVFRIDRVNE